MFQFIGVLRVSGMHCPVNLAGMERINVNIAVQSIEIAKVKVVDVKGNPLMVSGVVTFQIIDSKKAALDVKMWQSYLNTQAEVVLKQICSSHPYESRIAGEDSLKTEASKVRREIVQLLQAKVTLAGLHVMNFEAGFTATHNADCILRRCGTFTRFSGSVSLCFFFSSRSSATRLRSLLACS